jgi:hypothetical protein
MGDDSAMRVLFLLLVAAGAVPLPETAPPPEPASAPSFSDEVAPVLERWCVRCHGAREQQGGLRLDDYAALIRGGDSGPAVVPGHPEASLLVAKIERRDRPPMPPRRHLPRASVALLRAWIAAGAAP